ncbi:MAG: hypothetical protein HC769_08315 [Cyanobacteria bacterium CRU_2_1]|nr:hypothetical protein [Cyanobacteria bacterium RU_5_0]NJR58851.1 hypothetical protein [Cyanobacteria bacterium CRU_2_1]
MSADKSTSSVVDTANLQLDISCGMGVSPVQKQGRQEAYPTRNQDLSLLIAIKLHIAQW